MAKGTDDNFERNESDQPVNQRDINIEQRDYDRELYGYGDGQESVRSEEIREAIQCTRHRLDNTLDELQDRLSPKELVHATFDALRENIGDIGQKAACMVRSNPAPFALIGAGLVWLLIDSVRKTKSSSDDLEFQDLEDDALIVHYEEEEILNPIV